MLTLLSKISKQTVYAVIITAITVTAASHLLLVSHKRATPLAPVPSAANVLETPPPPSQSTSPLIATAPVSPSVSIPPAQIKNPPSCVKTLHPRGVTGISVSWLDIGKTQTSQGIDGWTVTCNGVVTGSFGPVNDTIYTGTYQPYIPQNTSQQSNPINNNSTSNTSTQPPIDPCLQLIGTGSAYDLCRASQ